MGICLSLSCPGSEENSASPGVLWSVTRGPRRSTQDPPSICQTCSGKESPITTGREFAYVGLGFIFVLLFLVLAL